MSIASESDANHLPCALKLCNHARIHDHFDVRHSLCAATLSRRSASEVMLVAEQSFEPWAHAKQRFNRFKVMLQCRMRCFSSKSVANHFGLHQCEQFSPKSVDLFAGAFELQVPT